MRKAKRFGAVAATSALILGLTAMPALAGDHLFTGSNASGAGERGFGNPVATNPSGTSGAAALPGTVPGEGSPNAGADQGTPSVDLDAVTPRSGGHGGSQ